MVALFDSVPTLEFFKNYIKIAINFTIYKWHG